MTATTTKSKKAKSRALQNSIAQDLRAHFPPLGSADINPAVMGSSGMDILLSSRARDRFPFATECKNQESLNIRDALRQTESNAEKERLMPLLVFKRNRIETYAILCWADFIGLLKVRK